MIINNIRKISELPMTDAIGSDDLVYISQFIGNDKYKSKAILARNLFTTAILIDQEGNIVIGSEVIVNSENSIVIGSNIVITGNNSIQLGPGVNNTDNLFQVYSYPLLNLQTGKIPKGRLEEFSFRLSGNTLELLYGNELLTSIDLGELISTIESDIDELKNDVSLLTTDVSNIKQLIPDSASPSNILADKAYVNEKVQTVSANFRGNWINWDSVPNDASLYPEDYAGSKIPTINDYLVIADASDYFNLDRLDVIAESQGDSIEINDASYTWSVNDEVLTLTPVSGDPIVSTGNSIVIEDKSYFWELNSSVLDILVKLEGTWRFKYIGDWNTDGKNGWIPEYQINESPLTMDQLAALNSGITKTKLNTIESSISQLSNDKLNNIKVNGTLATVDANKNAVVNIGNLIADENNEVYGKYKVPGNWIQSNITSSSIVSLIYGNNIFIAGSNRKGLYYSTDGATWTKSNITSGIFYSLTYGNNLFIAAGKSDNGLYYSSDGITWTQSNINSINFSSLIYINNTFIAGSTSRGIYYSLDGITWTQSTNITSSGYSSFTYGNNLFIAGSASRGLYYSTDGITWTRSNITVYGFPCLTYGNNTFIAGNDYKHGLYYSTDGITWTQSNITSGRFESLTYSNNKFIAGSNDNGLYYSNDGIRWTQSNITSGTFSSLIYDNNLFIAGGNHGIYYSNDGIRWTQSISGTFYSLAYGNNLFIAASIRAPYYSSWSLVNESLATNDHVNNIESDLNNKINNLDSQVIKSIEVNGTSAIISNGNARLDLDNLIADENNEVYGEYITSDPSNWTQSNVDYGYEFISVHGNNVFVAGDTATDDDYGSGLLYSINNGIEWIRSNITSGGAFALIFSNNLFIAGTNHGIWYSTNGSTWIQSDITSGECYSLAYGNNVFVACVTNKLYYSTDGITWTQSNTIGAAKNICFANGVFVACVDDAGIYYSTDGINWSMSALRPFSYNYSIVYGNGKFLVVSYNSDIDRDQLCSSTDGISWTTSQSVVGELLCYGDGKFIAIGFGGLCYSTDGITWTPSITGSFNSVIYGNNIFVAGSNTSGIYYSTDGITWTQSTNITVDQYTIIDYGYGVFIASGFSDNKGLYYSASSKANKPLASKDYVDNAIQQITNIVSEANNILEGI